MWQGVSIGKMLLFCWYGLPHFLFLHAFGKEPFLIVTPDLPVTSISEHLSVLVDPDDQLTVSQIIRGTYDDLFQENRRPIVSIGFSKATIWVRCSIENRIDQDAMLVVESSMARLAHADWFLIQDGQVIQSVRSGAIDLPRGLAAADQYPRIGFNVPAKKRIDLYLCAKSDTAIWFPLVMGSQTQFKAFERKRLMLDFFLLSVCMMIFSISLLFGFLNRQWMYVSLAITAIAYALIFSVFNGHVRSMIPGLPIWWERQFYGALTVLGLLVLISIDRKVFDLLAFPRIISMMRWLVIMLLVFMFFLQLSLDYRISSQYLFSIMGIGVLVYVLVCIYAAIYQGSWSSRILLAAWLVIIANFAVQQLSQSYVQPYTIQTLFLPAILSLFLGGLIQHQISLFQTRVKLSSALQAETEARLTALRSQLDPHFLFNSLTSIDALSRSEPSKIPQIVERLASFLRFRLTAKSTPYRTLIDELDALEAYLDIEKVRFGGQLKSMFFVAKETHFCEVPEMILQPLVENAIKHGFEQDKPVELAVSACLVAGNLKLEVSNRYPTTPQESAEDGFGIGLANTRDRLKYLYGSQSSLKLIQADGTFIVSLLIPSRKEST